MYINNSVCIINSYCDTVHYSAAYLLFIGNNFPFRITDLFFFRSKTWNINLYKYIICIQEFMQMFRICNVLLIQLTHLIVFVVLWSNIFYSIWACSVTLIGAGGQANKNETQNIMINNNNFIRHQFQTNQWRMQTLLANIIWFWKRNLWLITIFISYYLCIEGADCWGEKKKRRQTTNTQK